MNFYGRVIADAVGKIDGTTGRIQLAVEKQGLTDKLIVKVEGKPSNELVERALLAVYPELAVNTKNGNLHLVVEITNDLGPQIKDVKVVDLR